MASKITYDDKISLTTSALPRANKCTDDDLNEIKQVVNDNADELDENAANIEELATNITDLENKFNFSLQEQVIGTWIDGNPIYRKSFNIGNITSDVEINTNITNFAELISATGRGKLENQYWATLPQTNIQASGVYFAINLNSDGSKIQIKRSSNSFRSVVIILEYTKTTD